MPGDTQISIPSELLPGDGRFGSGPSRIPVESLDALAATGDRYLGTSHRRPTVKSVVSSIRSGLADMYDLPDGYEVVLGIGGATAFWDVAVAGLISDASAHFTCGEFSAKFASAVSAAPHLAAPTVIEALPGSAPSPVAVADVDTVAFIHNETSTGVVAPFQRLSDALVLVDGTSAAGAIPYDVASVDGYYFSPQKALASEGGLWIAFLSPAAIARAEQLASTDDRWIPPFLSLTTAIDNSRKDQTYNTPALATLWLLDRQIRSTLESGGLAHAAGVTQRSSDHLYGWAEASSFADPFVTDPTLRSPTVVTIDMDEAVSADDLAQHLRTNGIVDIESYRKLGRNQLRIATFPAIPTEDVEALTTCVDYVVDAM